MFTHFIALKMVIIYHMRVNYDITKTIPYVGHTRFITMIMLVNVTCHLNIHTYAKFVLM